MRRISLALALLGAVAAAGCGGAGNGSDGSGGARGVQEGFITVTVQNGQNQAVNSPLKIKGGKVTSTPAGINCGVDAAGVALPIAGCTATFPLGSAITLNAVASSILDPYVSTTTVLGAPGAFPYQFFGWAGDCQGDTTCALSGNADKYVVAQFAGKRANHPNFTDPAVHSTVAQSGAFNCAECHGASLQGVGIALGCTSCHTTWSATFVDAMIGIVNPPAAAASTGLHLAVQSVTAFDATGTTSIAVNFTLTDDQGAALNAASLPAMRFALANFEVDPNGITSGYNVLTPATGSPGTITAPTTLGLLTTTGQLTGNATTGAYTYTFPGAITYKAAQLANTHTLWIQATRQTSAVTTDAKGFSVVNAQYNFDANTGAAVAAKREVASTAGCSTCHNGFKPVGTTGSVFHTSARVEAPFCNICHNVKRTSNPAADSVVFIHRLHAAEFEPVGLPTTLWFHGMAATYPQDPRNCVACHGGAAQGTQYKTRPSRAACGSCHWTIDWVAGTNHVGAAQLNDNLCTMCHSAAAIEGYHQPVEPKDANNTLEGGTNSRTNAGAIAAVGFVPPGATKLTYDLLSVSKNASNRPELVFKFKKQGPSDPTPVDVVFVSSTAWTATSELVTNFVGSASAYFAWGVPQDGIVTPADFNASVSGKLRDIAFGSATGTSAGTLTGPDASGYYTVTLTGVTVPDSAVILTGGLGYEYSLPAGQPFTQTDVAAYPFNSTNKTGGLIVPIQNVWKTATGYDARRAIVTTDKCNSCHGFLGVAPSFHVGQRNDGSTCSFCHNPNKTSSGWSTNASTFIHGLHGAAKRTMPYGWHSGGCPTGSTWNGTVCLDAANAPVAVVAPFYDNIEYPGSGCVQCHVAGSYDFAGASNAAAVPNLLWSTTAASTAAANAQVTREVDVVVGTNYGAAFAYNAGTGVTTAAASTTLVSSPIAAACFSCHDSDTARDHMEVVGGAKIYAPRSTALAGGTNVEGCLGCHGPGSVLSPSKVH